MRAYIREIFRHGHFLTLALLAIVVGTVWAFVELADEMLEGELQELDARLLNFFRNPTDATDPIGPFWFEELMRDVSALGSVPVLSLLVLGVVVTLWMERRRAAAAWLTTAVLGALGISTLFKNVFARARPDLIAPELLPASFSFPSGHAFLSAAVYLTIGALLTRVVPTQGTRTFVLAMAVLLTVITGISRVYLGVHFPSDVLAGWTLGLSWAALCWLIAWNSTKR